jgi:hypothetical protein
MLNNIETCKRTLKYLVSFCIIALVTRYIPKNTLDNKEVIMIAMCSSIIYALLDIYAPSVSSFA